MSFPFRAKARPNKKAKLNKPADDNPATEPEQIPEQFELSADTIHDYPPPEHHETFAELMEDDPTGHATDPPSPAKAADKPPSPAKAADDQSNDVIVTGVGHTTPGNPIALSSYAHLNAQEIHNGFLNRLYTSRDYEAGLVGLVMERYEVNTINSS